MLKRQLCWNLSWVLVSGHIYNRLLNSRDLKYQQKSSRGFILMVYGKADSFCLPSDLSEAFSDIFVLCYHVMPVL